MLFVESIVPIVKSLNRHCFKRFYSLFVTLDGKTDCFKGNSLTVVLIVCLQLIKKNAVSTKTANFYCYNLLCY